MNEAQMLGKLANLPDPELLQASKITDPVGAEVFYSGRTVVKLLVAERKRCKAVCRQYGQTLHTMGSSSAAEACFVLGRDL
jgi:hypothetical protein